MKISIVFAFIALLLFGFTAHAQPNWELYDNFDSGQIDPQKWETDSTSAIVTVENGRLKVEHLSGIANENGGLIFIRNPKTIFGIKATITVESCSGDVRARIASLIGKLGNDYAFAAHDIRADRDYISSLVAILGPAPNYEDKGLNFWGRFKNPLDDKSQSFNMSMVLSRDHANYGVEGQGELEYSFPDRLLPTDEYYQFIGTRSLTGVGTCTAYFDDVYILRQPYSPSTNLLLLDQ